MPNTKLTSERVKEHFGYSKRMYIIGIIVAVLAASLIFDVTRHTPTGRALIEIALVDSYCNTEKLDDITPVLLERAQQRDEMVEAFDFLAIGYSGDASSDYQGAQLYTVQIYAGNNDIFIQNEGLTVDLASGGMLVQLDTLEGFEEFVAAHPDVAVMWMDDPAFTKDEDDPTPAPQHAYAFDTSCMLGFNTRGAYDIRQKYIGISVQCAEYQDMMSVIADLYELMTPAPETEAVNG